MPIQEETVYSALKQVRDPELMVNVVDLGLIYGVAVEEAAEKTNLGVMMTMTTPGLPLRPAIGGRRPRRPEGPRRRGRGEGRSHAQPRPGRPR